MSLFNIFCGVIVLVVLTDIMISHNALMQKSHAGRKLGRTCICAAFVCISYTVALIVRDATVYSILSSLYFVSIDFMLLSLIDTLRCLGMKEQEKPAGSGGMKIACYLAVVDALLFLTNTFTPVTVVYTPVSLESYNWYSYSFLVPGMIHLAFTYTLVLCCFYVLFRKARKAPSIYGRPYLIILLDIAFVVLINALFLFLPDESPLTCLDFSVCTYSLAVGVIYWCMFKFIPHVLPNHLKSVVVNSLDQGIVLFDFLGNIILSNDCARKLLPETAFEKDVDPERFMMICGVELTEDQKDSGTTQCYPKHEYERPLRCEYRYLEDDAKRYMGRLYVFSDAAPRTDPLTGFHNWDAYKHDREDGRNPVHAKKITVAVCVIDNLSEINLRYGRTEGDRSIRQLSENIRIFAPRNAYLLRGPETSLISICPDVDEDHAVQFMKNVEIQFRGLLRYAVCAVNEETMDIDRAITEANHAIRNKQMMDDGANRSENLSALFRALQACDPDTEAHVKRTRKAGMLLGRSLGLGDVELSNLSMLCLLHDIGKITVPLEILNKPGKLTEEEKTIIRGHARKGYEIAMASAEISPLADMILHHHERWDGKGYPDGLAGEDIPLLSRVISVVDAYDAMVSNRSYRNALSVEQAKAELINNKGTQFDPNVTDAFLKLLEKNEDAFSVTDQPPAYIRDSIIAENAKTSATVIQDGVVDAMVMPYCRYVLDVESRIIQVDERFETLTGYSEADIKEMKLSQSDLIPPEDRDHYLQVTGEQLMLHTRAFLQHRLVRKDGTRIAVFCYGRVYYDSATRAERSEIIVVRTDGKE